MKWNLKQLQQKKKKNKPPQTVADGLFSEMIF